MSTKILEEFREQVRLLKEKIGSLPDRLAFIDRTTRAIKENLTGVENRMNEIEVQLIYEISIETNGDEKPKPKFSNADARKAELQRRLSDYADYLKLKTEKAELDGDLLNNQIESDRLHNQFRANFAIKDLVVAEMNLYAQLKEAMKDEKQ